MRLIPIAILATLLILFVAGCSSDEPETGRVRVWLTDAPYPFDLIDDVTIFVEEVAVRIKADGEGESGWYPIDHTPQEYHLLDLQQGVSAALGGTSVPVGIIDQMRIVITEASVTLTDERSFELQVPSGASSGLKIFPDPPVRVESELTSEVLFDADVSRSFKSLPAAPQRAEDIQSFQFNPVLRVANLSVSGSVAGTIFDSLGTPETEDDSPLGMATVMAFAGPDTVTTATDATGAYEILGLTAGSWTVEASKMGYSTESLPVEVVAGNSSTGNDLRLTPAP